MTQAQAVVAADPGGELIESVITKGDLAKLSAQERTRYYVEVCKSVGLNPLTKPFEYITLNNKLTLYALRACTDQLRTMHGVSVEEMSESEREGVFIVTCKVKNKDGRTDMAKGAVSIGNLKGEALANAMMKAETKAKRRATLSLCGLGFLDESEIESVPKAAPADTAAPGSEQLLTDEHKAELVALLKETNSDTAAFLKYLFPRQAVKSLDEMPDWKFPDAKAALEKKKAAK